MEWYDLCPLFHLSVSKSLLGTHFKSFLAPNGIPCCSRVTESLAALGTRRVPSLRQGLDRSRCPCMCVCVCVCMCVSVFLGTPPNGGFAFGFPLKPTKKGDQLQQRRAIQIYSFILSWGFEIRASPGHFRIRLRWAGLSGEELHTQ